MKLTYRLFTSREIRIGKNYAAVCFTVSYGSIPFLSFGNGFVALFSAGMVSYYGWNCSLFTTFTAPFLQLSVSSIVSNTTHM